MSQEQMWKRMWTINFIALILVSGVLIALSVLHIVEITFAITFILIMAVFFAAMFFRQRSNRSARPDERIRRITTRAMGLSWQYTLIGVVALYLLDYFKVVSLGPAQILIAIILFMDISFFITILILRKLGDASE